MSLFTDKSTGAPTSWNWSFGDGTYSIEKNPVHPYSRVGKYTVSLTLKNAAGSNTVTKSGYVVVKRSESPNCCFCGDLYFRERSAESLSLLTRVQAFQAAWNWNFGDGTYSTARNPAHTYSKVGKYTVSLTLKNAAGK